MKILLFYRTTIITLVVIAGLLSACSQIDSQGLKANAEGLRAFKCIQTRTTNAYHFEYNNQAREMTLVSYSGDGIKEAVVEDTSNAFEKQGKIIWKHRFGKAMTKGKTITSWT